MGGFGGGDERQARQVVTDQRGVQSGDAPNELVVLDEYHDNNNIYDALKRDLALNSILITHHHYDHTGGIQALVELYNCEVYGPTGGHIEGINTSLTE